MKIFELREVMKGRSPCIVFKSHRYCPERSNTNALWFDPYPLPPRLPHPRRVICLPTWHRVHLHLFLYLHHLGVFPRCHPLEWVSRVAPAVPVVEQVCGIFYTTQDTLLLTYREEGSLLVVEEKREVDDYIA